MTIDSGMKLLLALIYAQGSTKKSNEEIRGITRLEKLLFLLDREGGFKGLYDFEAYDYGPWSGEVHDDIETLKEAGIVTSKKEAPKTFAEISDAIECVEQEAGEGAPEKVEVEIYSLTDAGAKAGGKLLDSLPKQSREKLEEIKKKYNSMPLIDLIRYIYTRYPEYAEASKIRDQILKPSYFGKRPGLSEIERDER